MFCLSCICGRLFTSDAQLKKMLTLNFIIIIFFLYFVSWLIFWILLNWMQTFTAIDLAVSDTNKLL